jgi:hypothetical protein
MQHVYLFMIILFITIIGSLYFKYGYYMGSGFYMGFPIVK